MRVERSVCEFFSHNRNGQLRIPARETIYIHGGREKKYIYKIKFPYTELSRDAITSWCSILVQCPNITTRPIALLKDDSVVKATALQQISKMNSRWTSTNDTYFFNASGRRSAIFVPFTTQECCLIKLREIGWDVGLNGAHERRWWWLKLVLDWWWWQHPCVSSSDIVEKRSEK